MTYNRLHTDSQVCPKTVHHKNRNFEVKCHNDGLFMNSIQSSTKRPKDCKSLIVFPSPGNDAMTFRGDCFWSFLCQRT